MVIRYHCDTITWLSKVISLREQRWGQETPTHFFVYKHTHVNLRSKNNVVFYLFLFLRKQTPFNLEEDWFFEATLRQILIANPLGIVSALYDASYIKSCNFWDTIEAGLNNSKQQSNTPRAFPIEIHPFDCLDYPSSTNHFWFECILLVILICILYI